MYLVLIYAVPSLIKWVEEKEERKAEEGPANLSLKDG